ncbi:DYW domain containing protein [Parasponia andersonii]|uniref:DYW domain containing protein n=1 Tax=Parasponia andersonii TaxID=3476 RepID=A0A2P5CWF5_PARAD|nr:DYW domain containing protein [Parasponia andersonii]
MEVPLSRYQSLVLDQIHGSSGSFSRHRYLFSGYCFSFTRREWRSPFSQIRCSSAMEQGLKPRPKLQRLQIDISERKETVLEETQIRKPSSGIGNQIEKLVLYKRYREALELFEILELEGGYEVSSSTYDALVSACVGLKSIRGVKRVFNLMTRNGFEPDLYLRNRVLLMHLRCGMMIDARKLFEEMPEKNLVSWNMMVAGHVDSGEFLEAFRLFLMMWQEFSEGGSRIFATMIRASAGLGLIFAGRQVHSCALKMGVGQDIFVSCALIDMYSKCGDIEDAQFVFDELPEKSTVGWNTIIAGYALHGYSEEALSLYYEMRESGVKMDHFTFSILVRICTRLASFEHAKQAHAGLVRHGFGSDIVANTALVDFYSKWGRIEDAQHVFDKIPCKNLISWNALIAGYGNHGRGDEAIELFEKMLKEGLIPNHVTFLAVLSACSYSGLSERGWEIFESMSKDHKIKPRAMHYACMIELLGRDGLLDEAYALLRAAPFKPTANMWAALLTACRIHENLELGKLAAEKLYGMEPEKLSNYIVLLNIYNSSGKLKEAAGVVQTLRRKGLRMLPVCTWIDVKKRAHFFYSGDKTHSETKQIYLKVDDLMAEIVKHGFTPQQKTLLPDVDENEERILLYHSEKLAIAYGMISTPDGTSLQIVQSHRVCSDCHSAIKLMALITGREIVLRDGSRFHRFKDGSCSCGDYW